MGRCSTAFRRLAGGRGALTHGLVARVVPDEGLDRRFQRGPVIDVAGRDYNLGGDEHRHQIAVSRTKGNAGLASENRVFGIAPDQPVTELPPAVFGSKTQCDGINGAKKDFGRDRSAPWGKAVVLRLLCLGHRGHHAQQSAQGPARRRFGSQLGPCQPGWLENASDLCVRHPQSVPKETREMNLLPLRNIAILMLCSVAPMSQAGTIVANCTGMVNLDIYTIDTEKQAQDVAIIGTSDVTITDKAILLTGAFGSYEFALDVGTLYHNGTDTGVYCTYKRK